MNFFLWTAPFAYGQTIITDRPDQTESSSTVPKTSLQFETGLLIESTNSDQKILAPTVLTRYGLTKDIELRLLTQYEMTKIKANNVNNYGVSDLEIGSKIQLYKKEQSPTEIAFISHLVVPTASNKLSNGKIGTKNKLSVSHSISELFGVGYNIGYDYFGTDRGDFTYSFALCFAMTNTLGIYIEPYGSVLNFDLHEANFDSGITCLIKDNFQLDLSYGIGINHSMKYFALGCSINIR